MKTTGVAIALLASIALAANAEVPATGGAVSKEVAKPALRATELSTKNKKECFGLGGWGCGGLGWGGWGGWGLGGWSRCGGFGWGGWGWGC